MMNTFNEIQTTFQSTSRVSYAHCIIAKSVLVSAPSFVLFVLGTDSKYTHKDIEDRWHYIKGELMKRGIKIYSNGSDGAGPFLKAMLNLSGMFTICEESNVPKDWTFFMMPKLHSDSLYAQDTVHLLAKLRTRLIIPSNVLSMGSLVACKGHLLQVLKSLPKEKHGLTYRTIDCKDKQNFSSIELLVRPCVEECLVELNPRFSTSGTAVYLALMRHIKEYFFNKAISPATRLYLIWKVVFFMRIWRTWLECNELSESDHFITNNAYVCIELNAHMLLNLVYNVATKAFPIEFFRAWMPGSQSCEQLFRLLRSMTPTFSTVVNFSMKGILEKIHKLEFISSSESDNSILFPRLGRRLFQIKEETDETFCIPTVQSMTQQILDGKRDAIKLAADCGMRLTSYSDRDLVKGLEYAVSEAVSNDNEDLCEEALLLPNNEDIMESEMQSPMTQAELLCASEDLSVLKLRKNEAPGIPTYVCIEESVGENKGRTYNVEKRPNALTATKSPFIQYNGAYIRKSTALYLLQENFQLSSDRLLRVRSEQPKHIFSSTPFHDCGHQETVNCGDLCIFKRVDDSSKCLAGRIIQFSYLAGNKRERQYSSEFVDMRKPSFKTIGVFANWFQGFKYAEGEDMVKFKPLEFFFKPGYLSMDTYMCTINDTFLEFNADCSFSISSSLLTDVLPDWKGRMTFDWS